MLRPFRTVPVNHAAGPSRHPGWVPAEAAGLAAISVTRFPGFATPPCGGCAVSGRCGSLTRWTSVRPCPGLSP